MRALSFLGRFLCRSHTHTTRGIGSLVETGMIVSIAAASLLAYATWTRPEVSTLAVNSKDTRDNISTVMRALEDFRAQYGRLPCPADPYIQQNQTRARNAPTTAFNNRFGAENLDTDNVSCISPEGMVPVRALGLEETYMKDNWGNQLRYRVSSTLCGSGKNSEGKCTAVDYKNNNGNITVKNYDGSALTSTAAYVLVSHGANGFGAFRPSGEVRGKTIASASEIENANSDAVFVATAPSSEKFDDIVRYQNKSQIETTVVDTPRPLIHPAACEKISSTLKTITRTEAADIRNTLSGLTANSTATGSVGSDSAVLELFWNAQLACRSYYSSKDPLWKGPRCPGGATYDDATQSCQCPNGSWSGKC